MLNSFSDMVIDLIGVVLAVFILNTVVCCLFDFDIVCFIVTFLKTRVFGNPGKSKDNSDGNS